MFVAKSFANVYKSLIAKILLKPASAYFNFHLKAFCKAASLCVSLLVYFELPSTVEFATSTSRRTKNYKDFLNTNQTGPLLEYFRPFHNAMADVAQYLTIKVKMRPWCVWYANHRMVGTDESTELWRPHTIFKFLRYVLLREIYILNRLPCIYVYLCKRQRAKPKRTSAGKQRRKIQVTGPRVIVPIKK